MSATTSLDFQQPFGAVPDVSELLRTQQYVADPALATAIFLSRRLGKPLFLEGEPGVGKTEVARALAQLLEVPLVRLQCYEGLDVAQALYEWNYGRQLLSLRASGDGASVDDLFRREFLIARPLLRAIDPAETGGRAVLLIDEIDRADEEFEAFLLEILADYQVTIPEIGPIRAETPPVVVLTSNRTREVHDALKRRCLYHWIDFPSFDKEVEIVLRRVPEAPETLAREAVALVQELRSEELFKRPGVAETIDWLQALLALDQETLSDEILERTLGVLLKYQDDLERIDSEAARRLIQRSRAAGAGG
ncbi:MAG: MoxR family ATPase [Acidobacteria bacterium]|nr:MAG: MoxR family ATPase [Acidobacteriota bacterium]